MLCDEVLSQSKRFSLFYSIRLSIKVQLQLFYKNKTKIEQTAVHLCKYDVFFIDISHDYNKELGYILKESSKILYTILVLLFKLKWTEQIKIIKIHTSLFWQA